MNKFNPIIEAHDDNLIIPEVRIWSRQKWSLMGAYANIFSRGMRFRWDRLVYIDLFSAAGFSRIKKTGKIYYSSALIAMSLPVKFDKYILCEKNPEYMDALKHRVNRLFPELDVSFVQGDTNEKIEEITGEIPPYSRENTLLPFCFVDPYSLNLHFNTIKYLSKGKKGKMDFLILLALHMDANRNLGNYLNDNSKKIELFVGDSSWRDEFQNYETSNKAFIRYLADKYDQNMIQMGYVQPANKFQVRSSRKNLPLYYLAFYSKDARGNDFYNKVRKTATGQIDLGL